MGYEKGQIRTDRGLFTDKGNLAYDPVHPDFGGKGADPSGVRDSRTAFAVCDEESAALGIGVRPSAGTYLIDSDITLAAGWDLVEGVVLQPDSGVTVTFSNYVRGMGARATQLDTSRGGSFNVTGAEMFFGSGGLDASGYNLAASDIPNLAASKITSGEFAAARIPNLDAAKISTGTFAVARIPNLAAGKITSGTFDAARIPSLDAAKISTGTFDAARIPSLDAAKISTGTFGTARIPDLPATKITAGAFPSGDYDFPANISVADDLEFGSAGSTTKVYEDVSGNIVFDRAGTTIMEIRSDGLHVRGDVFIDLV